MTNPILQVSARHWWLLLVRGIFAIIFGIITLSWPGATVAAVIAIVGVYLLFDGIAALTQGWNERKAGRPSGMWLFHGVLDIIAAIFTFAWPAATALVLLYILGIWAIIAGVGAIMASAAMRRSGSRSGWVWVLIFGILAVIFGLRLLISPGAGLLGILWFVGVWALVAGASMIVMSFSVRSAAQH